MADTILVLNAGSSSIKFQLFAIEPHDCLSRRMRGQIEGIGTRPRLKAADAGGKPLVDKIYADGDAPDGVGALDHVIAFLREYIGGRLPIAIGHRVVHGGPEYSKPTPISAAVLQGLDRLIPLAPLHQPNNLAPIRAILAKHPRLMQVACFDTAFHRAHPEVADRFAISEQLYNEGVRRYGFHGLSYEHISQRLAEIAPQIAAGRVVVAHLGSGASMCAIAAGKSVESTMGFTALDGLPMGTRPGQLDAGVVLYLMMRKRMSADDIQQLLYGECGLKALSGLSNDVRVLLASADRRAKLALDCFIHRVVLFAGMLAAAMGGIDGFVFTAGIGENAAQIRKGILDRLGWLGLAVDEAANSNSEVLISPSHSRVPCYVIATDEELMIAKHTLRVLREKT